MSCKCTRIPVSLISQSEALLSMPRGVDYEVIGFGMEVQPLFTYNEAWPLCSVRAYGASAVCIDIVSSH